MEYAQSNTIFRRVVVMTLLLSGLLPTHTYAAYTLNNKTFETYADMQRYLSAYMEAWRELHGGTSYKTTTKRTRADDELTIKTSSAENIDAVSAQLLGKIDFKNSKVVRIWFEYGLTPSSMVTKTQSEVLKRNNGSSFFDRNISGLKPQRTYYYRAVGVNEEGVYSYGNTKQFRTDVDIQADNAKIRVSTYSANDVQDDRATLLGNMNFRNEVYAYAWFQFGDEEKDLYYNTERMLVYKTQGSNVTYTMDDLDPETTYYFRMVGEDMYGNRSYSRTVQFKTYRDIEDEKPKVTIDYPQNINAYSAILNGKVDMNDYNNGMVFVVYGESQSAVTEVTSEYTSYKKIQQRGDNLQKVLLDDDLDGFKVFSKTANYLDSNTKYYYSFGLEYENGDGDTTLLMTPTYTFTTKKL